MNIRIARVEEDSFAQLLRRTEGMYVFAGKVKNSEYAHWYSFDSWRGVVFAGCNSRTGTLDAKENKILRGKDENKHSSVASGVARSIEMQTMMRAYLVCEVDTF